MMDLTMMDVARVAHEANRALQIAQADRTIPISPSWDDLDVETQLSAVDGVIFIMSDDTTPAESHTNWMRFKLSHGWVLGPVKDNTAKTHPLLVPYEDLPESARIKDDLFLAIVNTLIP